MGNNKPVAVLIPLRIIFPFNEANGIELDWMDKLMIAHFLFILYKVIRYGFSGNNDKTSSSSIQFRTINLMELL